MVQKVIEETRPVRKRKVASNGASSSTEVAVSIRPLKMDVARITVRGVTPLIVHQWSEKAKREIRDQHAQKARQRRSPVNPEQEFQSSMYRLPDEGHGFPAAGFKSAIVDATRYYDKNVSMELLKRIIQVRGEQVLDGTGNPIQLVRMKVGKPRKREDAVRIGKGMAKTVDLRYRAEYWPWEATLEIEYVAGQITFESLANIVNAAGIGGIGEWRPSAPQAKNGSYGRFEIKA